MTTPIRKGAGIVVPTRRRDPEEVELPEVVIGRDEIDESLSRIGEDAPPTSTTRTRATNGMTVDIDEPLSAVFDEEHGPWRDEYTPYVGVEVPETRIVGDPGPAPGELRFRDIPRQMATQFLPEGGIRDLVMHGLVEPTERSTQAIEDRLRDSGHNTIANAMDLGYDPEAMALNAFQGLTANRGDEAIARLDAAVHPDDPATIEDESTQPYQQRMRQRRGRVRGQIDEASRRAPGSSVAGNVAGSFLLGSVLPGAGANATLGQQVALNGALGVGMGGAYGSGASDEDLIDIALDENYTGTDVPATEAPQGRLARLGSYVGDGVDDAVIGGTIGAAVPLVGAGLRAMGRGIMNRIRGPQAPEVPNGQRASDAVTRMREDIDPFIQEGNGPKPDAIRAMMDAENAALGLPPENAGLPVLGGGARTPPAAPAAGAARELPPTAAPRPRALPSDTMVDDAAALLPDEAGVTAVDARPLGAQMRGRGAQMMPEEAMVTDVVDQPLPMPGTAPARRPPPVRIEPQEIPTPPSAGNSGPEARQWLAPRVQAAAQIDNAAPLADQLDAYASDEANMRQGRGIARVAAVRIRALMQRARAAQQVGDRVDVFLALDEIKRVLGSVQGNASRIGDRLLMRTARAQYEPLRVGLEDARAWGQGAAAMQRRVNAAWTPYLRTLEPFEQRFLEDFGDVATDPFETRPVARDEAVDQLVNGAQRWQGRNPRRLLRQHSANTARLGEELQGAYGGPIENVQRMQRDARGLDALVQLEELRTAAPATRAAEMIERNGGAGAASTALRWLGGMTDGIPNTAQARELRAIIDATLGGGQLPPNVAERLGGTMTRFAEFASRMGAVNGEQLSDLWELYQRVDPQAAAEVAALRDQLAPAIERRHRAFEAIQSGQIDEMEEAPVVDLDEIRQRNRENARRARERFGAQE